MIDALRDEAPGIAVQPLWSPPSLASGERLEAYTGVNSARIDLPGVRTDAVVQSTEPLVARGEGGALAPVNTALRPTPGGWKPENTTAPTLIREGLADGFELGEGASKLSIRPRGLSAQGWLSGQKAIFANAGTDLDVIAEAVPRGLSVSWAMRSPKSPEVVSFDLQAPAGTVAREQGGRVVLLRGSVVIGEVESPAAFDAQGSPVAVSYEVDGLTLHVRTAHKSKDLAYPIAVDPVWNYSGTVVIQDYTMYDARTYGFGWAPHSFQSFLWGGPLQITSVTNSAGSSGWWTHSPPANTRVFRAEFGSTNHTAAGTRLEAGIYGPGGWAETGWGQQDVPPYGDGQGVTSANKQFTSTTSHGSLWVTTCIQPVCSPFVNGNPALGAAGTPGNYATFQLNVDANVLANGSAWSSGGYVYYYENDRPWISYLDGLSNVWTRQVSYGGTIGASDGGVGMRGMRLKLDGTVQYASAENWSCGDAGARCPLSIYGNYGFTVPSDGPWDVQAEATDAVSNFRGDWQHTLRVDREGPQVVFSAQLAARKGRVVAEPTRVKIKATDGNAAYRGTQRSGVKRVQAWLDYASTGDFAQGYLSEAVGDTGNQPCPATHSCELGLSDYVFEPGTRPLGQYRIRVTACDHTDTENCTTDYLPFELGAGRAAGVVEGQRTARYVPLQSVGERNQTGVEFKYRLPASSDQNLKTNWQTIPQSAVRVVRESCTLGQANSACSSLTWPVLLKTPPEGGNKINDQLAWDLTKTLLPDGVSKVPDGPIEIVGIFTGGQAGKSDDVRMHYSQDGINSPDGTADFGPGNVDIVSGNLSVDATDVSVPAFKGDLKVGRTYNSRKWRRSEQEASVFGDGWTAALPTLDAAPEFTSVSYEPPTTQYETDENGDEQAYVEPGSAIVNGSGGLELAFEERADNSDGAPGRFTSERDAEHLVLTRNGPIANPTDFTIVDTDSDMRLVFERNGSGTVFELRSVTDLGSTTPGTYTASYRWERAVAGGPFRLKRFAAPRTPGMSAACEASGTLGAGCRWLEFTYGSSGNNADRLTRVDFSSYLPGTGKVDTTMAEYTYRAGGLLEEAIDSRAGTKTVYTYNANNLLETVTPMRLAAATSGGDRPWTITYGRQTIDLDNGRIETVKRTEPTHGGDQDALWQLRWFIDRGPGDGRPDLTPATLEAKFDQRDLPIEGTMIVPPGVETYEFGKSDIHYYNAAGRTVNVARPGNRVATTEYDAYGNAVRSLSASNRATALLGSANDAETKDKALRLSAIARYCTTGMGSRIEHQWSPERRAKLADNSSPTNVRTYTKATHGRYPGGCPGAGAADESQAKNYALVTSQRTVALKTATNVANGGTRFRAGTVEPNDREVTGTTSDPDAPSNATESDVRVTETEYDNTLLFPTKTTVDPTGLNLQTITEYDQLTGLITQQRTPMSASVSGHAGTRVTQYYESGSPDPDCNRLEYATWPCKVKQAGDATPTTAPKLLETHVVSYNVFGQPLVTREYAAPDPNTEAGSTRRTEISYRPDGQVLTQKVTTPTTRTTGEPVPEQTNTYHTNGRLKDTKVTQGGSERFVTREYDEVGRVKEYADAGEYTTGATSNRLTSFSRFDLRGRIKETWSSDRPTPATPKRTATYDDVTGDLTSVSDPDLGTVSGEYDADGRVTAQVYQASGARVDTSYDSNGEPTSRTYTKSGTTWHKSAALPNPHGQVAELTGANAAQDIQKYEYDKAGRLTGARDTTAGQCTIRGYEFTGNPGLNSNRTRLTTKQPGSGGACNDAATPSTVDYTYDTADRLLSTTRGSTNATFDYDILGRTTRVPAADSGGSTPLDATYFENDLVRTLTQDGKTTTAELDPAWRVRSRTVTGQANTELLHYADDSDEPLFSKQGSAVTREIEGLDGDLAATKKDTDTAATLKISNVHGDVIGEAPNTTASPGLGTATWATDEFGVPRQTTTGPGAAVITKVGTQKAQTTTNTTSITVTTPAGIATGDYLVAGLAGPANSAVTAPLGWTAIAGATGTNGATTWRMYAKYATATEPATYAFTGMTSGKHVVGITALRNVIATTPVNAVTTGAASGTSITAPSVTPTQNGSAILFLFGSNTGDNNGNEAWSITSPLTFDWSTATGASAASNRNAGMATRVLTGGANTATGTSTITNLTGHTGASSNAAIVAAITPATTSGGTAPQALPKYAYVGAKQRNTTLPTGVIEMGARVYVPQLGRFLQLDPVYGGSANDYEYAYQDPVNNVDLDGRNGRGIGLGGSAAARTAAARASRLRSNAARGRAAEQRVGKYHLFMEKNTVRVQLKGATQCDRGYRVPDFMNRKALFEVKYVRRLNYSKQMDTYIKYAAETNRRVVYYVRRGAHISARAQRAIREHNIIVREFD